MLDIVGNSPEIDVNNASKTSKKGIALPKSKRTRLTYPPGDLDALHRHFQQQYNIGKYPTKKMVDAYIKYSQIKIFREAGVERVRELCRNMCKKLSSK